MDTPEDIQSESFKLSCENFECPVDDTQVVKDLNTTFGCIYKIQFPNGKNYIGLTTSLERRTKQHKNCVKNGDIKLIYKALRKYEMVDSFELIEIDTATTLVELHKKEIEYIQTYKSHYVDGCGYNMTRGGEGVNGYLHTDDDKQKISEAVNKHYVEHPESRQKMSEISIRYHENNPEAAKEQSIRIKKYFEESPNAREKCSESQIKRFKNPAEREKYSENSKKQWENPDTIRKIADGKGL
jgi:group I intron endonuclease